MVHFFFSEIFCANTTTGEPKEEGAMIYWPKLGDTLEGIANKGPEYIYESQLTTTLVEEINELGKKIYQLPLILTALLHFAW